MRSRITKIIFIMFILLTAAIFLFEILAKANDDVGANRNYSAQFNKAEQKYIASHSSIKVYVDESLQYLIAEDGKGFLNEYLDELLKQSGMQVELSYDSEDADCRLMVITDNIRKNSDKIIYTAPVLQVTGKLYVSENNHAGELLSGVVMSGRLNDEKLAKTTYDGKKINWHTAATAQEAVSYAVQNDINCILGDKNAISDALAGSDNYIGAKERVYSRNVCMIADKDAAVLSGIINECIHSEDRNKLTYKLSQKWLGGEGPVYMQDDYGEIYILILIIFAAVITAFYIYYQSNKNLYAELTDRMNKLTESKNELRTTFNGVGHYMAELSLTGDIIDINRAFYGFVKDDVVNKKIWQILDLAEDDRQDLKNSLLEIEKKRVFTSLEVKSANRTLVIDIFPIENADGSMEKLLFMAMDVTNERMAERQMLQDNKMIAVGQLAAGVAHEIRNPLGIIRNYCYVLKNMKDEAVRKKAVAQIEKAVESSSSIINNLLDFSRASVRTGEHIDIGEHVTSLLALNKSLLKKKNISLQIVCEEKIETFISVESLDMVLMNLVSNATDAMEADGSLTINIKKNGKDFVINVADTGEGIDKNVLRDIFNPFFTTKTDKGGTGLGLYIVYNEISKMNGSIQVESKVGEGTRFRIALPINKNENVKTHQLNNM